MNTPRPNGEAPILLFSVDGDLTIREGDWLRMWNSLGAGIAHDVWVGRRGSVYENSGPGGWVRRNTLQDVLSGRKAVLILSRTAPQELDAKVQVAESKLGTWWSGIYNCQDFASEVATGRPQSFQREGILVLSAIAGGLALWAANQSRQ